VSARASALFWPALLIAGLTATSASADAGDAVAAGIAGGVAGGAAASASRNTPPPEFMGRELSDWIDPRTRATTRLGDACGHRVELRLSGTGHHNFLNITLSNHSEVASTLDDDNVVVEFESGLRRRLLVEESHSSSLAPGWRTHRALSFPSKEDFRGQARMIVELPLALEGRGQCVIRMTIERWPGMPDSPGTYVPHTTLEVYFTGGSRIAASGGIAELAADHGFSYDFGFGIWPWVNHGFFLEGGSDFYGDRAVSRIMPGRTFDHPQISQTTLYVGYAFRVRAMPWLWLGYSLGTGPSAIELSDDNKDQGPYFTRAVLPLRERLSFNFVFLKLKDGSEFGLAPTLAHTYVPFGSYGPMDPTGHTLNALVRLVFGG